MHEVGNRLTDCPPLWLQVSERQGKVRTYFISTMRNKSTVTETEGPLRARSGGRMTLAAVVYGLVQARHKEKLREANGGLGLTPCSLHC